MEKEYIPYMQDIFRALPQTFFLKDSEGKYACASKVCELVNAGSDGTLIGKKDSDIQYDKVLGKRYEEEDQRILKTGISTHTIDMFDVQGEKHYLEVIKNPIYNDEKEVIGIIGICNDVTELVIIREKYEQLSMYGHSAGDQYICAAAKLLKEVAPEQSVAIRWGGDEFLTITPLCDEIEQKKLMDKIRKRQEQYKKKNPLVGLAIGGAIRMSINQNESEILKLADERMYEDKALCSCHDYRD